MRLTQRLHHRVTETQRKIGFNNRPEEIEQVLAWLSGGRDALRTAGGTPALRGDSGATISGVKIAVDFDNRVRLFVYRFMMR